MAGETRSCSCGTTMAYRLGSYECPGCGRLEQAAPAAAQPSRQATPSPGSSTWDPGAQYRAPEARPSSLQEEFRAPVPPPVRPAQKHLWGTGPSSNVERSSGMEALMAVRVLISLISLGIILFRSCAH